MQIPPASTTPAASGAAAAPNERIGLADSFDSFLKLLTTQLKSQDPLSPMDANQFTSQLVQFTGVEQAIKTNKALDQLVSLARADRFARSVDYLGAEVEARGETVRLGPERQATLRYHLGHTASAVAINVRNEAGEVVFSTEGDRRSGAHGIPWDGRDSAGRILPEGLYRVEVSAVDARGGRAPVDTAIRGVVDGVEVRGEHMMLSVGGVLVPLDAVTSLRRSQAET